MNKKNFPLDRNKRDFLIFLVKTTGAIWLSRFFPLSFVSGCSNQQTSNQQISNQQTSNQQIKVSYELFPQSVASGDVSQNSAIIWTRTNNDPSPIVWQVAEDQNFEKILIQDVVTPSQDTDFCIKIKVQNLQPGKRYYYRFIKDNLSSPYGTFKTILENLDRIKFAFVSCQDYSNGFYSAWYHLAQEDLDFVVHLGDYIYETVGEPTFQYAQMRKIELNEKGVALYLNDYRKLYKIYRSDRYLQMAHEKFPFYIIWDDHEFANDSFQVGSPDNGKDVFGGIDQPQRRREASRAWWEYMPVDIFFDPKEEDPKKQIRIYRSFRFGSLAKLILTDERLYRSPHPCGEGTFGQRYVALCENIEKTSMLGDEQLDWFLKELSEQEDIIWKVHGNEVCISQMLFGTNSFLNLDQWDGYAGERRKILNYISQNKTKVRNYLVVTGDLHTFVAGNLYDDFQSPKDNVGVEFAGTSITSSNLGALLRVDEKTLEEIEKAILDFNKNLVYFNSRYHGYATCEITKDEAIIEFWRVSSIEEPEVEKTQKFLAKRFRVKQGENKIEDITPK
jgi:alkaline phosphatase D